MKLTSEHRGGEQSPLRCLSGYLTKSGESGRQGEWTIVISNLTLLLSLSPPLLPTLPLLIVTPAMPRPLHIVFAGGGQAANLYPGLAVAAHVVERMPDAMVTFLGTGKSLRHVVQAAGFRYVNFPSQPAPREHARTPCGS